MSTITRPDAETTKISVPLADARSEKALGAALDDLVRTTKDLAKLVRTAPFLMTTFELPKKKKLDERAFFEACAKHRKLHARMVAYTKNVNSRKHRVRGLDGDLCHDEEHPAGCFAIVPLALADRRYIDPLVEHMLGWDMDHETFHASLVDELLARHGICDETMRLLAYRAVDGGGQNGEQNLQAAYRHRGLKKKLEAPGAIEAFATLVAKQSKRVPGAGKPGDGPRHYLEIYVTNAVHALFGSDREKIERFIGVFRKRKVKFNPGDLQNDDPRSFGRPPAWSAERW